MRFVVGFVIAACAACAQDFASLEAVARDEMARTNVPGAAIAIVKGGKVVWTAGVGVASVETKEAVRPEMLFRLGSTTKMFTATALAELAVEGKIDLDAPVGKYIAGLPPRLATVTANQLLSHTAGILDTAPMYGSHDDEALGKGIRSWTDDWLFTSPGKIFSYSNPGYWMAGYLVETLSGKPYADAMKERIFQPLEMQRTTFRPYLAMTYPMAQGHEAFGGGAAAVARPAADNAASWPAGSLFSNVNELARFVIALMDEASMGGRRVLGGGGRDPVRPRAVVLITTPHAKYPDSDEAYGYGLTLREHRGVKMWEHGGSRMGYGSSIRMAPEQKAAVIVLANRSGASLPATTEKALEMLLPLKERITPARREMETTAEDIARVAGVYRNGDQKMEVAARNGKLVVVRGTSESALVKRGANRFAQENGAGEFVAVGGPDGKAEYLYAGSRSYARVK